MGAQVRGPVGEHAAAPVPTWLMRDQLASLREESASLRALLALSRVMTQSVDEGEILRLALEAVSQLSGCWPLVGYLHRGARLVGWRPGGRPLASIGQVPCTEACCDIEAQVEALAGQGGPLHSREAPWVWAYPLSGRQATCGYLVVGAQAAPSQHERFVLDALAQQAGAALVSAGFSCEHHKNAAGLRVARSGLQAANDKLTASTQEPATANAKRATSGQREDPVTDVRRQNTVHKVLARAAASGDGEQGIATALHALTGLAVAVEDPFGNLRAWGGPHRPERYPKAGARARVELLGRAQRHSGPLRAGDRLLALAHPHGVVLGVLALIDPTCSAGPQDRHALEHAATELAIELAHQRDLAEVELRLRRDLIEDLLSGADDPSVYTRAGALGYDLHQPHRVVAVAACDRSRCATLTHGIERAMTRLQLPALLSTRSHTAVMIMHWPAECVQGQERWLQLHREIRRQLGESPVTIGVGGHAECPVQITRSYTEARQALSIRQGCRDPDGLTLYDELGLCRVLFADPARPELAEFLRQQLGALLDYDTTHGAELVKTLTVYLDCGGNYDHAAGALIIHRSTLRYRLRRIRDISGHDLTAVDTRLDLHLATRAWVLLQDPC
jgi:sugar diacid utilization regulator